MEPSAVSGGIGRFVPFAEDSLNFSPRFLEDGGPDAVDGRGPYSDPRVVRDAVKMFGRSKLVTALLKPVGEARPSFTGGEKNVVTIAAALELHLCQREERVI